VNQSSRSLGLFFAASLALHGLFLLSWPRSTVNPPSDQAIQVALLPESREAVPKAAPAQSPPEIPRRARKFPAVVAKKDSPVLTDTPATPGRRESPVTPEPPVQKEPQVEPAAPRPPEPEQAVVSERPLPTLKQLLPPVTYSSDARTRSANPPISLNTSDPQYVTYVTRVRQSIESEWQYPETALRYGLQGKLALEFTILGNGQVEGLRLVHSSGSAVLDEEGLRAIKAAAPFPPIPPWIKPNPLPISATMEYRDSRLNYRYAR
jgi:periplasmic protein TonB